MPSGPPGPYDVPSHHMRIRLAWCFLALCAAWYTYDTILTQLPANTDSDFRGYYSAARHVLHGGSPFLEDSYLYPPLLALLMAPLGAIGYLAARWVWFVFSQACLLWADWRQGASLGLGIALKFLPGPSAIGLAMARCWRALWVAILCSLLGALSWVFASFALVGPPAPLRPTAFLAGSPVVLSWSLLSAAFIYPVPVTVLRAMAAANGDVWPNTPMANYFWISTAPVAGLVLYGLMVAEIARSRASAPYPRLF